MNSRLTRLPCAIAASATLAASLPLAAVDMSDHSQTRRPHSAVRNPQSPNVLIILSDDMGFSDIGCYGGEIKTPALDRLAAHGLRFTQFYNSARCCPTRASLLTGLYPHQAGIGHMASHRDIPGYEGSLRDSCMTIAEMLRPSGYSTYAVGKWHVSLSINETQTHPIQRGFDRYYGIIGGGGNYFSPSSLFRDNKRISSKDDTGYRPGQYYFTDAITDNAISYLQEHQRKNAAGGGAASKPFFMYIAYTAAHWPMHALPEDIAKYKGVYDEGHDVIRAERYKRALALGVITPQTKLSPPEHSGWKKIPDKEWEIRCMEVYAAMVDRMDQGIARIVAQLEASGQLDNTIILYLQDNGASAENVGRTATSKRQNRNRRTGPGAMPGPADTFIAYGRDWANVSNTPFREYKHWVHEGGIATPLVVHWPAGIDSKLAGTFVRTPGHLIDIAPTLLDIAGAKYPAKRDDTDLTPLPGISLRPAFAGAVIKRESPIFWEHEGSRAVRDGTWKLVAKDVTGSWELYDMDADRSETNNLASQEKARVARLSEAWEKWAVAAKVKPWPWDGWKRKSSWD